jgi:hypothetical protein
MEQKMKSEKGMNSDIFLVLRYSRLESNAWPPSSPVLSVAAAPRKLLCLFLSHLVDLYWVSPLPSFRTVTALPLKMAVA